MRGGRVAKVALAMLRIAEISTISVRIAHRSCVVLGDRIDTCIAHLDPVLGTWRSRAIAPARLPATTGCALAAGVPRARQSGASS